MVKYVWNYHIEKDAVWNLYSPDNKVSTLQNNM